MNLKGFISWNRKYIVGFEKKMEKNILQIWFSEVVLDRLLSCPECHERYQKPILMLPCEHNLCSKCAQSIYENKAIKIRNSRNGGARIRCPACRKGNPILNFKKYRQLLNYFNFDLKTVFRDCSGHAWRSRVNQKSPYWTANR